MTTHPIHCQNSEDLNLQLNCYDDLRSHFYQVPCLEVQKFESGVYNNQLPQEERPFLTFYDTVCPTYTMQIQVLETLQQVRDPLRVSVTPSHLVL